MRPYPHTYIAAAAGDTMGLVAVTSADAPGLQTAAPPEFEGPVGVWSPETLLCASLADCFILTFRAVARAARLNWLHLECRVEGLLERVGHAAEFTRFKTFANLVVPSGTDVDAAQRFLEQAEHACLIANSLRGLRTLGAQVTTRDGSGSTS
jgi:organic hydroperoxide reductase OsmC/OhrA